jgi:phosphate uptake regulator
MESRTIQLAGGTTYTVSLPKKWASNHGIEAGTDVYLKPHDDGSVVVRTGEQPAAEDSQVRISGSDQSTATVRTQLAASYCVGHDRLIATDLSAATVAALQSLNRDLLGVDLSTDGNTVVCETLLDTATQSLAQTLTQLSAIASQSVRDAAKTLGDHPNPDGVHPNETTAGRLHALLSRQAHRALANPAELDAHDSTRTEIATYLAVADALHRIVGHAATICDLAGEPDHPPAPGEATALASQATTAEELLDTATGLLIEGGDAAAPAAITTRTEELAATIQADVLGSDAPPWIGMAAHALRDIATCTGTVSERAVREQIRADAQ